MIIADGQHLNLYVVFVTLNIKLILNIKLPTVFMLTVCNGRMG